MSSLAIAPAAHAETVSPLFARGHTVIPQPQSVTLRPGDFRFGQDWHLDTGPGVQADSTAVTTLKDELQSRYRIGLTGRAGAQHVLRLDLAPDSVKPGASQDGNSAAIAAQAYRIELSPTRIRIAANAAPGLFYGVETLIQLLKRRNRAFWLPEGEITDWPDLERRHIYWDDAHHLERLSVLEAAVRQAAYFKINGFVIKLEGHFQFARAPALVEPQALSPAQFQELTDYGLRYHVQVIPYLDAPGHIAFILKHPEYAPLRAFPDSNYELCATNPDALRLLYGMYDDLLAANKGVKYFYLSTDEAYYVGLSNRAGCQEAARAKELGSVGKVLAEFVTKAAGYLHDRGRKVVFWGEYPLKPDDIKSLPSYLINGETYGEAFDPIFKAHGIHQMIYQSTEGEERLFPNYFLRPPSQRIHVLDEPYERVPSAISQIVSDSARHNANLEGLLTAGWADMGLHPETFWLGYAAITAAGWKPGGAGGREAMSAFYPLFYGASVINMGRVYQLMSDQAQVWMDTWDTVDSRARTPIWGNSDHIFQPPRPAHDQSIALPPAPTGADLHYADNWSQGNAARLRVASDAMGQNDELLSLLRMNLRLAEDNRYGLEVFLSIANLCRQNLDLLAGIERLDGDLTQADKAARDGAPQRAVEAIDRALAEVREMRTARNAVLADTVATWYKSWLPRVEEANGRRFLHQVDDVKDHLPDRTIDMSYLVYRELELPFGDWYERTESARNQYAAAHGLASRNVPPDWKNTRQ